MILNKEQTKLVTQLLGIRIAELRRQLGLDDAFEIKRKHHKYLVKELELAESMLDEIIDKKSDLSKDCFIEKVILKDGYRACCGKEMTDNIAEKYCKDVWLKT